MISESTIAWINVKIASGELPIQDRVARSTGTRVQVYKRGGEYETICDAHGGVCSHPTLVLARRFAPYPEEWCEYCMATKERDDAKALYTDAQRYQQAAEDLLNPVQGQLVEARAALEKLLTFDIESDPALAAQEMTEVVNDVLARIQSGEETRAWIGPMADLAEDVRSERAGKTLSLSAEHDIQCAINTLNLEPMEGRELVAAEVRRRDTARKGEQA